MHPVLFSIGRFHIYTYGVMVAAGIFLGASLFLREGRKKGIDPQVLGDVIIYAVISGVIFSRLFYAAVSWSEFKDDPAEILFVWRGGFVYWGALLGGIAGAWFCSKRKGLPFLEVLDLAAPFIPLAHAVGRIGCFSAGCCYGKECHLPWAIVVKDPRSLSPLGIPLHPVQLYSSLVNFFIFLVLYFFFSKRKKFSGELILEYVVIYGACRFFLEFFRGDPRPMVTASISYNQLIALVLSILSLVVVLYRRRA